MNRYAVSRFDGDPNVVMDRQNGGYEVAACARYSPGGRDFKRRAKGLAICWMSKKKNCAAVQSTRQQKA